METLLKIVGIICLTIIIITMIFCLGACGCVALLFF